MTASSITTQMEVEKILLDLNISKLDLNDREEKKALQNFLERFDLILDEDVEYSIVVKNNKGEIKATGSSSKNIFKCFAISEDMRGENLTASLITNLIDHSFENGIYHNFLFTKPRRKNSFLNQGFKLIAEVLDVALLEQGIYGIEKKLDEIISLYSINRDIEKSAIVMNCNPFTLEKRYLIEEASRESAEVIIFLVEEDEYEVPFNVRYELVKRGVEYLKNVKVIPSGEYIISNARFPTYFLKEANARLRAYCELDAKIFTEYFMRKFNITRRYVGEEPFCSMTKTYNESLYKIFKEKGFELKIKKVIL